MDGTTSAQDLLERIVEAAEPLVVIDRDGRRTLANQSARELLDTADATLVGLRLADALPWLRWTPFEDAWIAPLEGGVPMRLSGRATPSSSRRPGPRRSSSAVAIAGAVRQALDSHRRA